MSKFGDVWKKTTPYAQKAIGDWYIVRVNNMEQARFDNERDAQMMVDRLKSEGTFAVLICETVVGDAEKSVTQKVISGDYDAGPGEVVNLCVEYKDSEGRVMYRFFNTDAELKQFKQEMGSEITIMARGIDKSIVEKPAKFDRCVQHVKENNSGANAYAVCNAMISEKSFEDMDEKSFHGLIDKALNQVGITAGGPIPHSLLARQDLEGSSTAKSIADFTPMSSLVARMAANQKNHLKPLRGENFKSLWARVRGTNKV